MRYGFSIYELMKFVLFVGFGFGGLPLLINSLDGFSTEKTLPISARLPLSVFGGMMGAIVYFFTIPAENSDDPK